MGVDDADEHEPEISEQFEPMPTEARRARQFLRGVLERDDRFRLAAADVERLLIAANEVVTNAVIHARTNFSATVRRVPEGVLVEVADGNPRFPQPAPIPSDATSGRGMGILDAVGLSWGVERRPDGKVVWLLISPWPPRRTGDSR